MPTGRPNPAAGKKPITERVTGHDRFVNGKRVRVRSHVRTAQIARSKEAWIGLGFSSLSAGAIILEAGVTFASTLAIAAIAALTALAVFAGGYVEKNRPRMQAQAKARAKARQAARRKRKPQARRRTARTTQRKRR